VKYLSWLLKAAIFFTLFAFALNNQQVVAVNFFFGTLWSASLVLVVLSTFSIGLALGVLLMTPRWWKKRKTTPQIATKPSSPSTGQSDAKPDSTAAENIGIARHGL
jgi:lipopolysaccharide assembly protein A